MAAILIVDDDEVFRLATAELLRDEIFGPVAPIQIFRDEDEVVGKANE